ncbi:MAG: hypothetical protein AAFR21_17260, partial [Pseudomonadota bacterium]
MASSLTKEQLAAMSSVAARLNRPMDLGDYPSPQAPASPESLQPPDPLIESKPEEPGSERLPAQNAPRTPAMAGEPSTPRAATGPVPVVDGATIEAAMPGQLDAGRSHMSQSHMGPAHVGQTQVSGSSDEAWACAHLRFRDGNVLLDLANVLRILTGHDDFKGRFTFNKGIGKVIDRGTVLLGWQI